MEFICPKCKKVIPSTSTDDKGNKQFNSKNFPFCSERCKLIDMGAWLDSEYRIPTKESVGDNSDQLEDLD